MPIEPARAIVKPRVISEDGSAVPLENEIIPLLFEHEHTGGAIAIIGPAGSGKTTALKHLACFIPPELNVRMHDMSFAQPVGRRTDKDLIVYASVKAFGAPFRDRHIAEFRLAPWNTDDLIEYLLAAHKDKCASVMKRLMAADGAKLLEGNPELWRVVLDAMANDETVTKFSEALLNFLNSKLSAADMATARVGCLAALLYEPEVLKRTVRFRTKEKLGRLGLDPRDLEKLKRADRDRFAVRILRHPSIKMLLAREKIVDDLRQANCCDYLAYRLTRAMVGLIAAVVSNDDQAASRLRQLAHITELQPIAGSILHAAGTGWVPDYKSGLVVNGSVDLSAGFFDGADFRGLELTSAVFSAADLSHSNFEGGALNFCKFDYANLRRANLRRALMESADAKAANFSCADLSHAKASRCNFERANLSGAVLEAAVLQGARFFCARLDGAQLMRADLSRTNLTQADFANADFAGAKFNGAFLSDLCLRGANFKGASFVEADLNHSDLEFMELPGADFSKANLTGAYLTGTFIPKGNFNGANLKAAGLAEIEWERADLRGADLRGSTFHMGSSRSGHVNSTIACEGSRTGFYTDDYYEQSFKAPEQIRKANLRGADLRGANIDGVDFYLVDLREAQYDIQHEEHLRRCGAILETRV